MGTHLTAKGVDMAESMREMAKERRTRSPRGYGR